MINEKYFHVSIATKNRGHFMNERWTWKWTKIVCASLYIVFLFIYLYFNFSLFLSLIIALFLDRFKFISAFWSSFWRFIASTRRHRHCGQQTTAFKAASLSRCQFCTNCRRGHARTLARTRTHRPQCVCECINTASDVRVYRVTLAWANDRLDARSLNYDYNFSLCANKNEKKP